MTRTTCVAIAAASAAVGLTGAQFQSIQPQPRTVSTAAGREFSTPPGFVVERANPPDRTDSYVVLTFDVNGQPVVSKEFDHPRRLLDKDGDGIYESEQVISDKVTTCQGL